MTGVVLRVVASTVDDAEVCLCALALSAGLVGCVALAAPALAAAFRDWVAVQGAAVRISHPPSPPLLTLLNAPPPDAASPPSAA